MIIRLKRPMSRWRYRHTTRPLTPRLRHDYQVFDTDFGQVYRCTSRGVVTARYGHWATLFHLTSTGWNVCKPLGNILLPEGV